VVLQVGGAADLGGLTPPALSTPRPLSSSTRAGLLSGHGGLLHARQAGTWGYAQASCCWDARACLHACTRCGHTRGHASSLSHSLAYYKASWSLGVSPGVRRRALVRARLHTNAAWPHTLAHTRCVPLRLSQLSLQRVTPLKMHVLGSPVHRLEKCVTSRARASSIFSVARNAPPNLSSWLSLSHFCRPSCQPYACVPSCQLDHACSFYHPSSSIPCSHSATPRTLLLPHPVPAHLLPASRQRGLGGWTTKGQAGAPLLFFAFALGAMKLVCAQIRHTSPLPPCPFPLL